MKYQDVFPLPLEWLREVDISLTDTVVRWTEQEVSSKWPEHHAEPEKLLAPATQSLLVDIGLQSLLWPEEQGGAGLTSPDVAVTCAAVLEQVGAADVGIGFLLANTFALQAAITVSDKPNKTLLEKLAPFFCGAKQPAYASLVLPDYGTETSDPDTHYGGLSFPVRAKAKNDQWHLSGERIRGQCACADSKLLGVIAAVNGQPALFAVPCETPGVSVGEPFLKTGLAAVTGADLTLDDATVPEAYKVFESGAGMRKLLAWYDLGCAAVCLGAGFATWEILKEWGDVRVIKGKGQVFKENPLTAALMGKIGGMIALNRLHVYHLARMLARPDIYGPSDRPVTLATATAIVRSVVRSTMEAINHTMELMASAGYATEWNLERYWRDVKTVEGHLGPETAAQADLARHYFDCKSL